MSTRRLYQQIKNIYHWGQAWWWRFYYGYPDKGLKIYGVTGTNGKTTTSIVLGSIWREKYGREKVGLLTTIVFWIGKEEKVNATKMTTVDSREVFQYLQKMKQRGVKQVILEVTSHALDQYRLGGVRLDGGIILNVAREHLDYHETMEEYVVAKMKIVGMIKLGGVLIYKKDDQWLRQKVEQKNERKLRTVWFTGDQAKGVEGQLAGKWNKENILAASLLAKEVGIEEEVIRRGIKKVKSVPGRMEWVELKFSNNMLPRVLIDYAVTPDALERLYKEVREITQGKIFAVLGACGNRDRGKRPAMARVVAEYADELVLTREDPWTEDEEQIFCDLEKGLVDETGKAVWRRIKDRRKAITYCVDKAGPEDVVVVTGKGAEVGMAMGKKVVSWNDKEVVKEVLENKVKSEA